MIVFNKKPKLILLALLIALAIPAFSIAAVMTSSNYQIQSDSVNFGGGNSTSANYTLEDTLGEIATGLSSSASYSLKAGYQQMLGSSISIDSPADITMTALSLTQNTAVGSTAWTVTTDNSAGYTLSVNTSASPALVDSGTGESFADYTESSAGVKEAWSVSNAYEFGWSAFGADVSGYGSDADCVAGTDIPSATLLWEGFEGTTQIEMASSTSRTSTSGTASTICVATEQAGVFAPSGSYSTTVTVTAITL